jgi:hypothetical protein
MARVGGWTSAEAHDRLVAGVLAREPGLSLGETGQRMEPVQRADHAPREVAQPVGARDVDELVLDDQQAPLVVPARGRARHEHGGPRPAPGERRLDLLGRQQAHRSREVERAAGRLQRVEPCSFEGTCGGHESPLAPERAPQAREHHHDAGQPHDHGALGECGSGGPLRPRCERDKLARVRVLRGACGDWRRRGAGRVSRCGGRGELNHEGCSRRDRPQLRAGQRQRQLDPRQHRRQGGENEQPQGRERQQPMPRGGARTPQQQPQAERDRKHDAAAEGQRCEPGEGGHLISPFDRRRRSVPLDAGAGWK